VGECFFWYRSTRVVPDRRPLNGCVCVCVCVCSMRRQYVPLSLLSLQRLVDLGRVDVTKPIDLTTLCNTRVIHVDPTKNHYGINLSDEVCIRFREQRVDWLTLEVHRYLIMLWPIIGAK